ncbi:MAG: PIN domain-containing protein [Bacteroidales bacterium]|nr:PIN domain-containing protein [Bacteroidales bacterium]
MRVFVDANVIISVLNKEYPLFTYSARVLSLCSHPRFMVYASPLSLAIAFYFATKKSGEVRAKQKIARLLDYLKITSIDEGTVLCAAKNPAVHDFEDGMQFYAAHNHACEVIVTENKEDFYFGHIPALNCEEFLRRHVQGKLATL